MLEQATLVAHEDPLQVEHDDPLVWDQGKMRAMRAMGERVVAYQAQLAQTPEGLPLAYIDADRTLVFVASHEHSTTVPAALTPPDEVVVSISYVDGYANVSGLPLWERLDGELIPHYDLFKIYREMKYTKGHRSIARITELVSVQHQVVEILMKLHHWRIRAKAYDAFRDLEREHLRAYEVRKMEGRHASAGSQLFTQAVEYLKLHADRLPAKVALEMLETATRLERLSWGLPPDKPAGSEGLAAGAVVQITTVNTGEAQSTARIREIIEILARSGALPGLTSSAGPSIDVPLPIRERLQPRALLSGTSGASGAE